MKYCPKCKNKGWKPSQNFTKPLVHKGKVNYKSFALRYYGCMNCGARFKTIEEVHEYLGEADDLFSELSGELEQ